MVPQFLGAASVACGRNATNRGRKWKADINERPL